jgi:hypothetical protein
MDWLQMAWERLHNLASVRSILLIKMAENLLTSQTIILSASQEALCFLKSLFYIINDF